MSEESGNVLLGKAHAFSVEDQVIRLFSSICHCFFLQFIGWRKSGEDGFVDAEVKFAGNVVHKLGISRGGSQDKSSRTPLTVSNCQLTVIAKPIYVPPKRNHS